jgi:DNA-binding transcriptional MocR family regulator
MDPKAWLARVRHAADTLPHGQRPTELHVRVAAKLAFWRSPCPSHRALARASRCSRGTVLNALGRLRALGLLSWAHRTACGTGWAARTSNAYVLGAVSRQESIKIQCATKFEPAAAPVVAGIDQKAAEARILRDWMARRASTSGPRRAVC